MPQGTTGHGAGEAGCAQCSSMAQSLGVPEWAGGQCPGAALTKCHKLGGLNRRLFIPSHLWRLAGLAPSEENLFLVSFSFQGCHTPCVLGCTRIPPSSQVFCGCVQISPFYRDTNRWIRAPLLQYDLTATSHTCNNLISKQGPILNSWGEGCTYDLGVQSTMACRGRR